MDKSVAAQIYRHLPARNCGDEDIKKSPCMNEKCIDFAKNLLNITNEVEDCPYLEPKGLEAISIILAEYFDQVD